MNILLVTLFGIFIGASITAYIAVVAIEKRNRKILNLKAMVNDRDKRLNKMYEKLNEYEATGSTTNSFNKT